MVHCAFDMLYKKGGPLNPENYHLIALLIAVVKIFTQIRLVNKYNNRIVTKNGKITFSDLEYCELCIKTNSLAHRLIDCTYHKEVREKYLGNLFDSEQSLFEILNNLSLNNVNKIAQYINHIM